MDIIAIPNQIIRKELTPLDLTKIDAIAFHHMAHSTWGVKDVEYYHVYNNGWPAIGYNYWIAKDGTVYKGRGLNRGAAVSDHNSHIISVGLQGDFEKEYPTEAQYKSARELTEHFQNNFPSIKTVGCHKDWNQTACPGKNFDIKKIFTKELTTVNDIVWELSVLGIITDKALWLKKLEEDTNAYHLARKCLNKIRGIL